MTERELPSPFLLFDSVCRIRKIERYQPGQWTEYICTADGWQWHDDIGEEWVAVLYQSDSEVFVGVK